jgi:hypothetical protein
MPYILDGVSNIIDRFLGLDTIGCEWTGEFMLSTEGKGRKRSGSSTLRYLNSSAHGAVPVLHAGGETYLWMPAPRGLNTARRTAGSRMPSANSALCR